MQIERLFGSGNIAQTGSEKAGNAAPSGSLSFDSFLSQAMSSQQSTVPESWSDNRFGLGAVDNAAAMLMAQGVDTAGFTPTYEATAEQTQWLSERNNLSGIAELGSFSAEEQNLLADLVYLGIISAADADGIHAVQVPEGGLSAFAENSGGDVMDTLFGSNSMGYLERLQQSISAQGLFGEQSGSSDFTASKTNTYKVLAQLAGL